MKQIDHIPGEKRPPKWIWKAAFALAAVFWVLFWVEGINWPQVMLGIGTGIILMGWAMEKTGGETPASWRSKTPRN
ncbi:hypothetical protein GRI33_13975 [Brucella sp. BO3]|uniref:hypothetical protein n=1 Tax=unclassified Brucella TaxID=2632610 RepID=UPI00084FA964|nr:MULTISPECIES: hypothetical protein [unclassified Brucella]OEI83574.1 hypothetical protein BA060_11155 [Brucella sp. B13-0095]QMV28046.1 hypothetical protein GRI33_13975 [Brucella sp. BO3]